MKKITWRRRILVFTLLITCIWVSLATACEELCFPVELRDGETDVCVTIFENENSSSFGATVLAIHGLTGTAQSWRPLVEEMFNTPVWGNTIKNVVALDLPGHGKSPMPKRRQAVVFGRMLIDDNISIVIQSIKALANLDLAPSVIMGHSMGGLAVQGVQETLLSQDSSLARLGISRAILLAPVPVLSSVWTQGEPADVTEFISYKFRLGFFFYMEPEDARNLSGTFLTLTGELVPNAPTVDEVALYNAPEPISTLFQLAGVGSFLPPRPDAREGAFGVTNGTLLNVISFSQDVLVPAIDLDDLYAYLTGSDMDMFYRNIEAPDACHGMHISNPAEVVKVLKELPPL